MIGSHHLSSTSLTCRFAESLSDLALKGLWKATMEAAASLSAPARRKSRGSASSNGGNLLWAGVKAADLAVFFQLEIFKNLEAKGFVLWILQVSKRITRKMTSR